MVFQYRAALVTLADIHSERLVEFYRQLLGQEPKGHIPHVYAEFELPGLRLGIFQPRATHESEFAPVKSSMSLCLEVSDLEAAIAHVTALGYPPLGELIMAAHGKEIYAYDPAGNRLILHQSV